MKSHGANQRVGVRRRKPTGHFARTSPPHQPSQRAEASLLSSLYSLFQRAATCSNAETSQHGVKAVERGPPRPRRLLKLLDKSYVGLHLLLQCGGLIYYSIAKRTFASTSARGADITLTVDGKEVTVPAGAHPATGVLGSHSLIT